MLARLTICWWLSFGAALSGVAADPRPAVGPGATKDDVLKAYGWPNGVSRAGTKEILTYAQGKVTLDHGRVEKVDFSVKAPWQAPKPRPGPSPNVPAGDAETSSFWLTDFEAATREAAYRRVRILALFNGSDWSPASRQFDDEVVFHPEFINAFMGDFVFLRLDFPKRPPQPGEAEGLREHNAQLRERYQVTVYPTLLVLSPAGDLVAKVDLDRPQKGETYRARTMAAVRAVRDRLSPRRSLALAAPAAAAAKTPAPETPSHREFQFANAARSARMLVFLSVVLGLGLSGTLLWLVWRRRPAVPGKAAPAQLPETAAANGLPTPTQISTWTTARVRAVTAALAESEGYVVDPQPAGADKDLVLKQPGDTQPRVLVWCAAGTAGPVAVKRVREFYGTLATDGVATGWCVAPAGFGGDARAYADKHGIVLIDGQQLLNQLRELSPMVLPKVLAHAA